ncbi:MAG: endonuclease/exonuclease/phosphatase family protein [Hyphomicrobiales bacterium]|nr:endonuclease/exonuclease/phosphatase family protein [Hyphomicrobiales bacterium]MCP5371275.1 endonuclease/exonuclease/phosphatase family protein [Hyphomicrobiales bacterium]
MRLVTYNIQYGTGRDGQVDLGRIAEAVRGADVIALQEVERHWTRSGMADQPAELAALLPDYHWVYGPPFDVDASQVRSDGTVLNRRRQFGNMLLSRRPIFSSRLHLFPMAATVDRHNLPYGALEGVIDTAAGPVRFHSLHLSYLTRRERLDEIAVLMDLHRRAPVEGGAWTGYRARRAAHWQLTDPPPAAPVEAVLMGDFNMTPGSPEYEALAGYHDDLYGRVDVLGRFVDAWVAAGHGQDTGVTYPAKPEEGEPDLRLDYCFVSTPLAPRLGDCWIDGDAAGSDHQPVWTEIDL